jgi:hypothetical protein
MDKSLIKKIFYCFIAVEILFFTILSFYTTGILGQSGAVGHVLHSFETTNNLLLELITFLFIISAIFGNWYFWHTGDTQILWLSFLVFAIFNLINYSYIQNRYLIFQKAASMLHGSLFGGIVNGMVFCVGTLVVLVIDLWIVKSLRNKKVDLKDLF